MRRLIVTGLPCPPEVWENFMGHRTEQRILPLLEVLDNTDSSDLRVMSRYVSDVIESFGPQSIVCHDFGVPLTLLALLRLKKKGRLPNIKLTLFNGAFRKVDVFQANHAFRAQWMTYRKAVKEIESAGGEVDQRLKRHFPRIRAMYRRIILYSLTEKLQALLGLGDFAGHGEKPLLKTQTQMILSPNDPYIPAESLEQLRRDFPPERRIEIPYGHFPYSIESKSVLPLIEDFER
jgi:pimeloyl-ACP methyl ester carboxylesterase